MGKIVCFEDGVKKYGVVRFVKSFRHKRLFRKEKISYTLSSSFATEFDDVVLLADVCNRVKKDYPNAKISCMGMDEFLSKYMTHEFWIIVRCDEKGDNEDYFSSYYGQDAQWTHDINDSMLYLDYEDCRSSAEIIRRTGDRILVRGIFLNLINELLTHVMMITCASKRGDGEAKYFSKLEGNRVRLVNTSNSAKKFTYREALECFDYLCKHNKSFWYAVLPVFKDNVHYKNIEAYMREKKISRMIMMTHKLNWFNR